VSARRIAGADIPAAAALLRRLREDSPFALMVIAPAACVCGLAGLYQHYCVKNPWRALQWLDSSALNHALDFANSTLVAFVGFFIFEPTNDAPSHFPFLANLGKILVIALVFLISQKVVLRLFFEDILLGRRRQHAVILGLGERGMDRIGALARARMRVVAVDADENCPMARPARAKGAIVLTGDATSREVLQKARVAAAAEVHIFLPDDNLALDAARECRAVAGTADGVRARVFIYPWTEKGAGRAVYEYDADDVFECDAGGALAAPSVVVCGFGERGQLKVAQLLAAGRKRIVVLDDGLGDAGGDFSGVRARGVLVLRGDPHSAEFMRRAGVPAAGEIHIFAVNDNHAAAVAMLCHDLFVAAAPSSERRLECFVHVARARSQALFLEIPALSETHRADASGFLPEIINDNGRAARQLLLEFAPRMFAPAADRATPPHIVIVGGGNLGQNLVLRLAPILLSGPGAPTGRALNVTVIDSAPECGTEFAAAFPFILGLQRGPCGGVPFILPHFITGDAVRLDEALAEQITGGGRGVVDGVFFCVSDEMASILAARAFSLRFGADVPIVICTDGNSGLDRFAHHIGGVTGGDVSVSLLRNVFIRNVRQAAVEDLAGSAEESIARMAATLHNYWDSTYKMGEPWERTTLANRHSSLEQATCLFLTLRCMGMRVAKEDAAGGGAKEPAGAGDRFFTPQILEVLARMEHRRWMIYHYMKGWDYAPQKDKARRLHTDLVPWEMLGAIERRKDMDPIRLSLNVLRDAGYQVLSDIGGTDGDAASGAANGAVGNATGA